MPTKLLTIGHSSHSIAAFIALLKRHGVAVLVDVRSRPSSRFCPQFNRAALAASLAAAGVDYRFHGAELGARNADPACQRDGRADYGLIAATPPFQRGLDQVRALMATAPVCLMCAERDPLDCHRTILVAVRLQGPGVALAHLLADGGVEPHEDAERRLLARHGLDQPDLFKSDGERLAEAYRRQGQALAWRPPPPGR